MDALETYKNTSKSLPTVVITLLGGNPVQLNQQGSQGGPVDFDPTKSNKLEIQVSDCESITDVSINSTIHTTKAKSYALPFQHVRTHFIGFSYAK